MSEPTLKERMLALRHLLRVDRGDLIGSADLDEALTLLEEARERVPYHDGGFMVAGFHLKNNPDCFRCRLDRALGES